jgi:hypothetical protein
MLIYGLDKQDTERLQGRRFLFHPTLWQTQLILKNE